MKAFFIVLVFLLSSSSIFAQNTEEKLDTIIQKLDAISGEQITSSVEAPQQTQDTAVGSTEILQTPADIIWVIIAAALVFFMQTGFCMLELGASRSKNCLNVATKNVIDFAIASLAFLLIGFSLMFGADSSFISFNPIWLSNVPAESRLWTFWLFQVVFVATAATIASGAMAERTKFSGYLIHTFILSAITYPIIGSWVWGGDANGLSSKFSGVTGWLANMGFVDFAGSSVVHVVGGSAALAGIIVLGPRKGRFTSDGTPKLIAGHNIPLVAIGTLILWLGWFGFNGGSTLTASSDIARIIVNTIVAGAAGGIIAMIISWAQDGKPELFATLNGVLAGLVAVTACCDVITPFSAVILGGIAGVIGTFGATLLLKLKLDDVVGAVPVHLFCGIWGTLGVAIFNEGGFYGDKFVAQILGAFTIAVASFATCYVVFISVEKTVGLRASDEEQEDGLDFAEHSATAYPDFATREQ